MSLDRTRRFPIMNSKRLKSIPWAVIEPHCDQAVHNHKQTLEQLAARGGLSPCEAIAVLQDRKWHLMRDDDADALIVVLGGELGM